jgi:hypothetical protein
MFHENPLWMVACRRRSARGGEGVGIISAGSNGCVKYWATNFVALRYRRKNMR